MTAATAMSWGSETRIRSCGEAVVLVDEPAEEIPPTNVARADLDREGFNNPNHAAQRYS